MKQRIATLFVGGLVALALHGGAAAGPYEDGQAAYDRQDYAAALKLRLPLAEQGDPRAEDDLGAMYEHGQGVP